MQNKDIQKLLKTK
jgi:hypothetical protein